MDVEKGGITITQDDNCVIMKRFGGTTKSMTVKEMATDLFKRYYRAAVDASSAADGEKQLSILKEAAVSFGMFCNKFADSKEEP